ncbi:MAG: hypothetical protein H6618_06970 [Deltaproteobacteria bacterium]|nr:hypothetical protein [Deltaproteobacteria bacterium]
MLDRNEFKRKVKIWIKEHPDGTEQALTDYCDELIPAHLFSTNQWLIEQTLEWYRYVLSTREQYTHSTESSEADE